MLKKAKIIDKILFFYAFIFIYCFFFLILQPISVFWSQSIIAEHVLYDTKSPDVHAEPSEAMPL